MAKNNKQYYILQWRNRYSGDTGFVGHIRSDHFENTFDVNEARKFSSVGNALVAVHELSNIGECDQNDIEVIPL